MSVVPADPSRENLQPLETLTLAAWFGLLAGIGESLVLAFRKFVLHHSLLNNLDMLWTGPIASLLLVMCLGILLQLLSRLLPKLITWRVVVGPVLPKYPAARFSLYLTLKSQGPTCPR